MLAVRKAGWAIRYVDASLQGYEEIARMAAVQRKQRGMRGQGGAQSVSIFVLNECRCLAVAHTGPAMM